MEPEIQQKIVAGEQFAPDRQQVLASLNAGIKRHLNRRRVLVASAAGAAVVVATIGVAAVLPVANRQPDVSAPLRPAAEQSSTQSNNAVAASDVTGKSVPEEPSSPTAGPPTPTDSQVPTVETSSIQRGSHESEISYELRLLLASVGTADLTGDGNSGPMAEFYGTWHHGIIIRVVQSLPTAPQLGAEHMDELTISGTPVEVVDVQYRGLSMRFGCSSFNYEVQAYDGTSPADPGQPSRDRTGTLVQALLDQLGCQ